MNNSKFGEVYDNNGLEYLATPNTHLEMFDPVAQTSVITHLGIRLDRTKEFSGVVERFSEVNKVWFEVKTKEDVFIIARNWVSDNGWLKPGDKIEGVLDIGDPKENKAWYVRRVVEKTESAI